MNLTKHTILSGRACACITDPPFGTQQAWKRIIPCTHQNHILCTLEAASHVPICSKTSIVCRYKFFTTSSFFLIDKMWVHLTCLSGRAFLWFSCEHYWRVWGHHPPIHSDGALWRGRAWAPPCIYYHRGTGGTVDVCDFSITAPYK